MFLANRLCPLVSDMLLSSLRYLRWWFNKTLSFQYYVIEVSLKTLRHIRWQFNMSFGFHYLVILDSLRTHCHHQWQLDISLGLWYVVIIVNLGTYCYPRWLSLCYLSHSRKSFKMSKSETEAISRKTATTIAKSKNTNKN